MLSKDQYQNTVFFLVAFLLLLMFLSVFIGAFGGFVPVGTKKFVLTIMGYRFTRGCLALVAGSSLAISGASLQALFRNPLADPHLFGISGGAALGASLSVVFFQEGAFFVPSVASFLGGLGAFFLMFMLANGGRNFVGKSLLAGLLVNSVASSIITFLKTVISAEKSQNLMFWLVGHLGVVSASHFVFILVLWIIGSLLLFFNRGKLEVLSYGEDEATVMGINATKVVQVTVLANCLLIANVVSFCGMIGFIGLVIPHILRLVGWGDLRTQLPLAFILGALLLVFFDGLSRVGFRLVGTEVPVGALVSLFLSPVLFWLLIRSKLTLGNNN